MGATQDQIRTPMWKSFRSVGLSWLGVGLLFTMGQFLWGDGIAWYDTGAAFITIGILTVSMSFAIRHRARRETRRANSRCGP